MLDLGRTLIYAVEREPSATAVIDGDTTLTLRWLEYVFRVVAGLDNALHLRSTPPGPPGARRGYREPMPPSAPAPSRTSPGTATATASGPSE